VGTSYRISVLIRNYTRETALSASLLREDIERRQTPANERGLN
jgi:hypothetical protein